MKAIFLDRDGVINRKAPEGRYITSWLEVVFLPGVFDAVVSLEVVEHLMQPRHLVARAYGALRPGGVLVMSTPYHGYLKNLALALTNGWDTHWHPLRDFGHVKFFSRKTLSQLVCEAGFSVRNFVRVGRIPPFACSMIVVAVKPE